jgi:hypothetical protein
MNLVEYVRVYCVVHYISIINWRLHNTCHNLVSNYNTCHNKHHIFYIVMDETTKFLIHIMS